jgi:methylated-DNA-[protein]-cysteine S-methyltransferase
MSGLDKALGVTVCQTAFGWVGVAWSAQGLVSLTLPRPTEAGALSLLPPATELAPKAVPGLDVDVLVDKLCRYFDGEDVTFDEPLDPSVGTEFQRRVWAVTRAIRRGQTRTYGQIAHEVSSLRAARAVGQAMARNPWPVVVPCHRVVGSRGDLVGFGGGLSMKRKMLAMEGAQLSFNAHQATQLAFGTHPAIFDQGST